MIDISGLDHADVVRVLYDAAKPQGMGFLHYTPERMAKQEASDLLTENDYFDYCKGRVMKVKIRGTEFNEWLYDRDNGPGAAATAIDGLRAELNGQA